MSLTLPAAADRSLERVDWTYVNSRIADATVMSGAAHHFAVQRDAAESAERLMSLSQRAHQRDLEGRR